MMYEYKAKILSIYDGDGVMDAEVDMGMNLFQRKDIRVYGIDTPEIRGEQHDAGIIVRDYVRKLILNKEVILTTQRDKTGKYGRLLASIQIGNSDLGEHLLAMGYAKPYDGGKKDEWSMEEIDKIIFGEKHDT